MAVKTVINAADRRVPLEINGQPVIPFKGVGKHRPSGRKYSPPIPTCSDFPPDGNKVVSSLEEALKKCGLRNGMTISTHHHLRDGDLISNRIFEIASAMGVKDLVWFPSASFPCNDPVIKYLVKWNNKQDRRKYEWSARKVCLGRQDERHGSTQVAWRKGSGYSGW